VTKETAVEGQDDGLLFERQASTNSQPTAVRPQLYMTQQQPGWQSRWASTSYCRQSKTAAAAAI